MSNRTSVNQLLASALQQAADVARARLDREVTVVAGAVPDSAAILRFDLSFTRGGRLSWFVSNEDATGFSDMLIGGQGDRSAVLTEMHLDALTVAFSDMLTRAVEGIVAGLDEPIDAGDLDLGMEGELPTPEPGGCMEVLALDIAGFGPLPIVQLVDAQLGAFLEQHAVMQLAESAPVAAPAAATPFANDAPPMPAGPVAGQAQQPVADGVPVAAAPNVVQLPAPGDFAAAAQPGRAPGDLEMLMNVPLPLTVELGRAQKTIRELVDFSVGSIIELGKLAGDPLDIMVNDRVIARGEVVVIDEEFGIRVTEIVSPEDRLRGLG